MLLPPRGPASGAEGVGGDEPRRVDVGWFIQVDWVEAALHGVLTQIEALGLELLEVRRVSS